jgi:hypothetical protein
MTITITAPGEFISQGEEPVTGRSYFLEDATEGSGEQNRAFHALISEYWRTGMHSYPAKNFDDFRKCIKRSLGAGFEAFVYVDPAESPPVIHDAKKLKDIPKGIPRNLIRGRLRSWSDYTKVQRSATISKLIAEMIEAGVNSKKFIEIREGMKSDL